MFKVMLDSIRSRLILVFSLMLLSFSVLALEYEEGIHYQKLDTPIDKAQAALVEELFFYGCVHCYHLEPTVKSWLTTKPKAVNFRRIPAVFNSNSWIFFARVYAALESLEVTEKVHEPLFDALHRDKQKLFSVDALADFFSNYGVDPGVFKMAFNSFSTDRLLNEFKAKTDAYQVDSVPVMIVSGRYKTDVSMAGSPEELTKLVNWLVMNQP